MRTITTLNNKKDIDQLYSEVVQSCHLLPEYHNKELRHSKKAYRNKKSNKGGYKEVQTGAWLEKQKYRKLKEAFEKRKISYTNSYQVANTDAPSWVILRGEKSERVVWMCSSWSVGYVRKGLILDWSPLVLSLFVNCPKFRVTYGT